MARTKWNKQTMLAKCCIWLKQNQTNKSIAWVLCVCWLIHSDAPKAVWFVPECVFSKFSWLSLHMWTPELYCHMTRKSSHVTPPSPLSTSTTLFLLCEVLHVSKLTLQFQSLFFLFDSPCSPLWPWFCLPTLRHNSGLSYFNSVVCSCPNHCHRTNTMIAIYFRPPPTLTSLWYDRRVLSLTFNLVMKKADAFMQIGFIITQWTG